MFCLFFAPPRLTVEQQSSENDDDRISVTFLTNSLLWGFGVLGIGSEGKKRIN